MSKKLTGRNFIAKFLKPKVIKISGTKVISECLTCEKNIKETLSRNKENRGKFCSKICSRNFKVSKKHLEAICKDKFNLSIEELKKEISKKKLNATKLSKIYNISPIQINRLFKLLNVNQYYNQETILIKRYCKNCNKEFSIKAYPSKLNKSLFCSSHCKYIYKSNTKPSNYKLSFKQNEYSYFKLGNFGEYRKINLGSRELSVKRNIKYNDYFFKNGVDSEETAYTLGLWYADGNVGSSSNNCKISLTDHQIIIDLAKILNFTNKIYERKYEVKNKLLKKSQLSLNLTSPFFRHDLIQLGCTPNKTYHANYPDIDTKFDKHFIRGLIDGDGSFSAGKSKDAILKLVGTDKIMYGVAMRIKKHLGLNPQSLKLEKGYKMKNFSTLIYSQKYTDIISKWLYDGAKIYLKRKFDKAFFKKTNYMTELGTQKIADVLKISRLAVTRFIKDKKNNINYKKIGKYHILPKEYLEDFLFRFNKYVQNSSSKYYSDKDKLHINKLRDKDFLKV